MIFWHKAAPMWKSFWGYSYRSEDDLKFQIINSFLTETIYNHESMKYAKMHDIKRNYRYERMRFFLYPTVAQNANGNNGNNDHEEKYEHKYNESDKDAQTLRMQHLLSADGFIIVYDVRDQTELIKVRKYLQEIFELKGYDKYRKALNENKLSLFPITLMGINHEIVEDKTKMISKAQILEIAMEYNLWQERMSIHLKPGEGLTWPNGLQKWNYEETNQLGSAWNQFARMVLDYHYYQSLTDEQINNLLNNAKSDCIIL